MLRQKLFLVNLIFFLLLSTLSTSLIYYRARQTIRQAILQKFDEVAHNVDRNVGMQILREVAEANVVAISPQVKELLSRDREAPGFSEDVEIVREFFNEFFEREDEHHEYDNVILFDAAGEIIVNLKGGEPLCDTDKCLDSVMTNRSPLVMLGITLPQKGVEHFCTNYPVLDENRMLGVVRIMVQIDVLLDNLEYPVSGEGHIHLLTSGGRNVYGQWDESHSELFAKVVQDAKTQPNGHGTSEHSQIGSTIYTYHKVDDAELIRLMQPQDQLIVLLYQSQTEIFKPLTRLIRDIVFIWLGLFIVTSIGLNYYTKKFIRPIEELQRGVLSITRGELDTKRKIMVDAKDEIGSLAESFNEMAATLHSTLVSRDYLDAVFRAMGDIVVVTDLAGKITRGNAVLLTLSGYQKKDLLGQSLDKLIKGSMLFKDGKVEITLLKEKIFEEEVRLVAKNGEQISIQLNSSLIKGNREQDQFIGLVNVGRDLRLIKEVINKLEEQSNALKVSERKYRGLIESSPLATVITQGGKIVYSNPAFARLTHMNQATIASLDFQSLISEDNLEEIEKVKELWEKEHSNAVFYSEVEFVIPAVGHRHIDLVAKPIEYEMKQAVLYIMNDITEKQELQQYIFRGERLSVVGTLAAGVAHEFNNIIGGILGYAELAENDPSFTKKLIEVVFSQGERVRQITQGLLSFASRREEDEEMINLPHLLDEVSLLLERSMTKAGIKLQKRYPERLEVYCSPAKLQQAVLSLLINAKEAIHEEGEIEINALSDPENKSYSVIIKDSGCGITPQDLEKIFDPFFSTKGAWGGEDGGAIGLGLTHAYNLVKSMGGEIQVQSQPQVGSQFTIILPQKEPDYQEWIP